MTPPGPLLTRVSLMHMGGGPPQRWARNRRQTPAQRQRDGQRFPASTGPALHFLVEAVTLLGEIRAAISGTCP